MACWSGNAEMVKLLLDKGASASTKDSVRDDGDDGDAQEGSTALHLACRDGHLDVIKTIMSRGGDINAVNSVRVMMVMMMYSTGKHRFIWHVETIVSK